MLFFWHIIHHWLSHASPMAKFDEKKALFINIIYRIGKERKTNKQGICIKKKLSLLRKREENLRTSQHPALPFHNRPIGQQQA